MTASSGGGPIALDTNVIVRYLVEDDAVQTAKASALIRRAIADDQMLFLSDVVVCETVWVLRLSYGVSRSNVVSVLRKLFRARHLAFAAVDQLIRALDAFETGTGDFADYLIREHARAAECEVVATFDRSLLKEHGFVAVR